jgi:hypothetical protein
VTVELAMILHNGVIHGYSSNRSLLFWINFQRHDSETFAETSDHSDWDATINEEYRSLVANDTWDVVPLSKGRKLVRCKWVYRTKCASVGSVKRHKAWSISKGFSQVEGIDYNETFSPVVKMVYICLVLALATSYKWEVHQMDV